MAIGRRVTDPIRVVSTTADTALDRTATPLLDYIESRDPALPRAIPGQRLTWFTLRPLPSEIVGSVRTYQSPLAEQTAFLIACSACDDADLLPPDSWTGDGDARRLKGSVLARLPDQLWQELGAVALRLGTLTVGEAPRFGLPAGLPVTRTRPNATTVGSATGSGRPDPGA
jgi:hypothetical protein